MIVPLPVPARPEQPVPAPRSGAANAASRRQLGLCILVVIVASLLAAGIQSSWGRVQVVGVKFPTQNGQWLAADVFRPKTATREHPAPLVVVVPGFQRSKETMANVSLELARRGIVAIAIDPYAQGASSASSTAQSATTEGYGLFAVVDYAANTGILDYVDRQHIAATGHSAGGNAVIQAASHFGREAGRKGGAPKLQSVYVSGYVLSLTPRTLAGVHCNVGLSYALFDEGAYRNELKHGDMRRAPEALRLVNASAALAGTPVTEVEIGKYYGDAAAGTLRVVYNERVLHPLQPYSVEAVAHQLEYFEKVFGWQSGLSSRNQVWIWKELLTLASLVAALVALVPLGRVLIDHVSCFRPLLHPLPPAPPKPSGTGRLVFWTLILVGAVVACFTYIPLTELSQRLFVAASNREQTWFFPQRMNNGVMLWAHCNGVIGFLLFALGKRFSPTRPADPWTEWGMRTTVRELGWTVVLAVTLAASFFLLLAAVYYIFHVDYRFVFMGARPFQPAILLLLPMYAPAFLVFFLSNSLRVNSAMRLEGQRPWVSLLIGGLANSLGLLLIVVVQYAAFAVTGTVHWTDGWLYVNLLFAVVPVMFVLPYFNRYFFVMTGRIYLGPMTMCLVFILILLSNTVSYTPL